MSYFAAAIFALLLSEILMISGYGYPHQPVEAAQTLVLVHIVAIGWLSLLMCGALFQFVPVLVARPLHSDTLPLPTLACLIAGLAALLSGFMQMGGQLPTDIGFFPVAAALLGAGFGLVLWNLGRTLWAARPLPLPARFVVVGLYCVGATVCLGIVFALTLNGTTNSHFSDITANGIPLHAIAGLGGWLTFTAMGVSYRLLAMFMLAPELDTLRTRVGFYCGTTALAIAVAGGVVAIFLTARLTTILALSGLTGLCALGLYGADIIKLYRARKRKIIELNSRIAAVALANLAVSVLIMIVLLASGTLTRHIAPVTFLFVFGWLTGLGLGKLYKIVAFLTWLECYGPVLGKIATPRVQDLVIEPRAYKWFVLHFLAVWAATIALFSGAPSVFQACALLLLIADLGIALQLVRTRRLADVTAATRLPEGVQLPQLLQCRTQQA
jgi:hypothetical protein